MPREDYIFLKNLFLYVKLGVLAKERKKYQKIKADIKIFLDLVPSSLSDEISDTLDYEKIYKDILFLCSQKEWKLVESFARDLANLIKNNKKVKKVEIEISKFVLDETTISGAKMYF